MNWTISIESDQPQRSVSRLNTLHYCIPENRIVGGSANGLMLSESTRHSSKSREPVSERILTVEFWSEIRNISILLLLLCNKCMGNTEEREVFYEQLSEVLQRFGWVICMPQCALITPCSNMCPRNADFDTLTTTLKALCSSTASSDSSVMEHCSSIKPAIRSFVF